VLAFLHILRHFVFLSSFGQHALFATSNCRHLVRLINHILFTGATSLISKATKPRSTRYERRGLTQLAVESSDKAHYYLMAQVRVRMFLCCWWTSSLVHSKEVACWFQLAIHTEPRRVLGRIQVEPHQQAAAHRAPSRSAPRWPDGTCAAFLPSLGVSNRPAIRSLANRRSHLLTRAVRYINYYVVSCYGTWGRRLALAKAEFCAWNNI
jgi:hypothetical protein